MTRTASGRVRCERMTGATRDAARGLLAAFLGEDPHYRASEDAYGGRGAAGLSAALDLFLARPEIGFVWLARLDGHDLGDPVVGACVCCYAISTSRGTLVAKLDDVTVAAGRRGQGIGAAMLRSLALHLRAAGVTRIDCACHRENRDAWRFYEQQGFRPLDEERIALVFDAAAP